jgi:arginase family enzyme
MKVITYAKKNDEILKLERMLSFGIVEVNPVIDEHNRTADLAVELARSAFGKKILYGFRSREAL